MTARARAGDTDDSHLIPSKKYRGVFWDDDKDTWLAQVKTEEGSVADCGHFQDEEEAARHYDECVVELLSGSPELNFPES